MNGDYSAVAAKLKAIEGSYLRQSDYDALLSKSTVFEVYEYLASHDSYKSVLSELKKDEIHRSRIEKCLRHEMLREYSRVYHFMTLKGKRMLEFWFSRREIEFLKRGLRHLYNHENSDWISCEDEFEEFFKKHTKLDFDMIETAKTFGELIEACRNTPYANALKRSQNIGADYASISMMLDKFYYGAVWKAKDRYLSGKDKKLFEDIFGIEIDMSNILWIYRGKKYFGMSSDMLTVLIPHRFKLSEDTIKSMLSADSDKKIIEIAGATPYKELFEGIDEGYFPEENMNRIYYKKSKHILENEPESMAAVYAYFDLKKIEINNITTLIESIRYGRSKEITKRHINMG